MTAPPIVAEGACVGVRLRARLCGGCRITAVLATRPIVDVVDWFGDALPGPKHIRRAKRLSLPRTTAGFERVRCGSP